MATCKVCNEFAGNSSDSLRFHENGYGHKTCFYPQLNEICPNIPLEFLHYQPLNLNPIYREATDFFELAYESLKRVLLKSSLSPKTYYDDSEEIQVIIKKFQIVREICNLHQLKYDLKLQKFYSYNFHQAPISDEPANKLLVLIDFFARKTGVIISVSKAIQYIASSAPIYLYLKN